MKLTLAKACYDLIMTLRGEKAEDFDNLKESEKKQFQSIAEYSIAEIDKKPQETFDDVTSLIKEDEATFLEKILQPIGQIITTIVSERDSLSHENEKLKKAQVAAGTDPRKRVADAPMIAIKYIGHRDTYKDPLYRTNIVWDKDETIMVPADAAVQMLKHPDVWVEGSMDDASGNAGPIVKQPEQPQKEKKEGRDDKPDPVEDKLQEARDFVNNTSDRGVLKQYIHDNFSGHSVHPNTGLEKLRLKAINLIDQFGLPE